MQRKKLTKRHGLNFERFNTYMWNDFKNRKKAFDQNVHTK